MSRIIISHEISRIGKIDIPLYECSTIFYNFLTEYKIIDYLNYVDHLGYISYSHTGTKHSRWDYVMLQFFLLSKLNNSYFDLGLNSNSKISKNNSKKVSGIEALQIFILFSNIGHIKGTIASESGLFEILLKNKKRRELFLKEINKIDLLKNYANKIFKEFNYYKFNHLIAFNFLLNNNVNSDILDIIIDFLENDKSSEKTQKNIYLFNQIRQIAFIYLDSNNSDFPFQIEINKILINIYNYKTLFNYSSKEYKSFLDAIEKDLTKKLYLSEKSLLTYCGYKPLYSELLKKELNKKKKSFKLENFLTSTIHSNFSIKDINTKDIICLQYFISKEDIIFLGQHIEVIDFKTTIYSILKKQNYFDKILTKDLDKGIVNLQLIHDYNYSLFYCNIIINIKKISESNIYLFICNYFKLHNNFIKKFKFKDDFIVNILKYIFTGYIRKIFLQLIKVLFNIDNLTVYIKFAYQNLQYDSPNDNFMISYSANLIEFQETLKKIASSNEIGDDIKNNILLTYEVSKTIKIENPQIFYCLIPVEIKKGPVDHLLKDQNKDTESPNHATDIDVIICSVNEEFFELYLIEGKNSYNKSKSDTLKYFNEKIIPNLKLKSIPTPTTVSTKSLTGVNCRGGYLKISNI